MEIVYYLTALVLLLILLYYFSRLIVRYLTIISLLLFHNAKIGVYAYSIFFLPGILVHELSHFLMAALLGVPTGEINIFPKEINDGDGGSVPMLRRDETGWLMGSVQSTETDPLRANLIGIAPMIVGIGALTAVVNLGLGIKDTKIINFIMFINVRGLLFLYLLLAISNNMYLSPSDRRSIWAIPSLILVLGLIGFGVGQINGVGQWFVILSQQLLPLLKVLILSFGMTAGVDFVFIALLTLMIRIIILIPGMKQSN